MGIGDFSRITHLSSKALRHYHREGLLVPRSVHPANSYREYHVDQVATAQLIRRLRALDVPVDAVRRLLASDDAVVRRRLVEEHLAEMEERLAATRRVVAELRDLVAPEGPAPGITRRTDPERRVLLVEETIELQDLDPWYRATLAELRSVAAAASCRVTGPAGGLWSRELFLAGRGRACLYLPVDRSDPDPPPGRVRAALLPGSDLAVLVHRGTDATIDRAYGDLGRYVVRHELGAEGPVRERYLAEGGGADGDEVVTEIGWPVLRIDVPAHDGDAPPAADPRP
ncbi:MerR family transcriptional regulator [Clavibacter lycopersici]|uniref:MerR family transcriptional regulator n=2 Tax=Clavibacter lycopersici TaxID=2301718 RepID=A0A399T733_9MICO|nr:MerR family transcriptional regulator [Clavibacter lycopersici]RIJ61682.1 MerR family transcriptional regulator [Clavibacter lycopersici]